MPGSETRMILIFANNIFDRIVKKICNIMKFVFSIYT